MFSPTIRNYKVLNTNPPNRLPFAITPLYRQPGFLSRSMSEEETSTIKLADDNKYYVKGGCSKFNPDNKDYVKGDCS